MNTNVHPVTQTQTQVPERTVQSEWSATGPASICKCCAPAGLSMLMRSRCLVHSSTFQSAASGFCLTPAVAFTGIRNTRLAGRKSPCLPADTRVEVQQRGVGEGLVSPRVTFVWSPCDTTRLIKITLHAGALCPVACGWDSRHFYQKS